MIALYGLGSAARNMLVALGEKPRRYTLESDKWIAASLVSQGLVARKGDVYVITPKGIDVLDAPRTLDF